jgi:phenylacetate-CoA ligase
MIVTPPSNLAALAEQARSDNIQLPSLKYLKTMGEVVSPEIRDICREVWGLKVVDIYSCRELNILGLQCPETDHYHVQSERIILEVLDKDGRPCGLGETGRVVLTDLHNYAMPFIRYEIGDFAEVGGDCICGRSLPVLTRVLA